MKIFSARQIKEWDVYTIKQEPVSSLALMERAAAACVSWIAERFQPDKARISIFCGKGNNGGDGLVIARLLLQNQFQVEVYILSDRAGAGSKDFEYNLQLLRNISSAIFLIKDAASVPTVADGSIIIDALFGTGLNKPLEGLASTIIEQINLSNATVIAIDMPSGMYADESSNGLTRIKATHTLSFQQYKTAFLLPENEHYTGKLHILDIGLHPGFYQEESTKLYLTDLEQIRNIYSPPASFSHKGTNGHALLVAGSYGKMGAAVLAARACLRAGAGLLTSQVPEAGYNIIQNSVPEAMADTDTAIDFSKYKVIGAGPGCGTNEEATMQVSNIIMNCNETCKLVLDADALNIISAHQHLLELLPVDTILTPHPKEFERLFGQSQNDFDRFQLALQKASALKCYIILKGHFTFIATPGGTGFFNSTGNAGMATGGTGDALTGILTGLASRGYTPLHTCLLGVFLHGLAGDIAAEKISQEAMLPSDLIDCIGAAYQRIIAG